MDTPTERIFVPAVPPHQRHALIFATFDALPTGGAFDIVNDHDPLPLQSQFERTRNGQFAWQYLVSGPVRYQVRISRVRTGTVKDGGGCGGCSGG